MEKVEYYEKLSKSGKYVINSFWGKAKIMTKKEIDDEFDNNEEIQCCEPIKESEYRWYIDMEVLEYYAVLK